MAICPIKAQRSNVYAIYIMNNLQRRPLHHDHMTSWKQNAIFSAQAVVGNASLSRRDG